MYGFAIANLPLVIAELVAMVISWNNVRQQDVFGFGVHTGHFYLVAGKHPSVKKCKEEMLEKLLLSLETKATLNLNIEC